MIDWLQSPAMVVTVVAAWMVGSQKKFKRNWGFWLFLISNVLWIIWGWHDHAYALILLQLSLASLNIRGALKNRRGKHSVNLDSVLASNNDASSHTFPRSRSKR